MPPREHDTDSRPPSLRLVGRPRVGQLGDDPRARSLAPSSRRNAAVPTFATELVGRTLELATLDRLVLEERRALVTVHGPGGMGKTRLVSTWAERALAAGEDVAYCALAPLASGEHFASAVADAIGLAVSPDGDVGDAVVRALRQRHTILVLDNLEHLASDARVTGWLHRALSGCPTLRVVGTSRDRLGLASEHVLPLAGLALGRGAEPDARGDAFALFAHRAKQVLATFDPLPHREAITTICALVEGVPLGIELAAAWVRVLQCDEIRAEIEKTLDFLTADSRSAPNPRQGSMRAVFSQSWALLGDEERAGLAALSVFRGGFHRTAAEQVAGASLSLLASLVDRSLVRVRSTGRSSRYDMHELLRQFAAEQLAAQGRSDEVARRHAEYFAARAVAVHPQLRGESQVAALAELTSDVDNMRAAIGFALEHERYDLAAHIGWALWPFWWIRNMQHEGRRWLELLMRHADRLDLFWRTQATIALGAMTYAEGDATTFERYATSLEALAREAGNPPRPLAFAQGGLGFASVAKGDVKGATPHLERARELFLAAGDPGIAAQAAAWIGTTRLLAGNLAGAEQIAKAGLAESLASGDRLASTTARYTLARVALASRRHDIAIAHLVDAIGPSLEIDDRGSISYVFELLGVVLTELAAWADAAAMFGASDAIVEAIGHRGHTYYMADAPNAARARENTRRQLGERVYSSAYEAGRVGAIDDLVAEARGAAARATTPPDASTHSTTATSSASSPPPALAVRYFEEDDSVFLGHEYLIKGVSGRLLWRMLQLREAEGRDEFSNKELRLDPALKLPSFKDNLEARLILLAKRLAEKSAPLRLERPARGRLKLTVDVPVALVVTPAKP